MPPFREFLQHQRSAAKREPAAAQPSLDYPIVLHRESDAIQVKANRQFHVGDVEEGEHFLDIVIGVRTGIHAWNSRNYLQLRFSSPIALLIGKPAARPRDHGDAKYNRAQRQGDSRIGGAKLTEQSSSLEQHGD
jgi:hypothetical protein